MGYYKNAAMPGYRVRNSLVELDATGSLGMLKRLRYDEIIERKQIRKEVREVLRPVQKTVQNAAKGAMGSDPRKAYLGVKLSVYGRKAVGGSVSLLNQRSTGRVTKYSKPRGGASGITRNRKRSKRTQDIENYQGRDRAFILRFINQGTTKRTAFTRTKSKNGKTANRGALSGKGFFSVADGAMKQAADTLGKRVEKLIVEAGYGK